MSYITKVDNIRMYYFQTNLDENVNQITELPLAELLHKLKNGEVTSKDALIAYQRKVQ